jgi:hypothetical protein
MCRSRNAAYYESKEILTRRGVVTCEGDLVRAVSLPRFPRYREVELGSCRWV